MDKIAEYFSQFKRIRFDSINNDITLVYQCYDQFSYTIIDFTIADLNTPKIPEIFHITQRLSNAENVPETATKLFKFILSMFPHFNFDALE